MPLVNRLQKLLPSSYTVPPSSMMPAGNDSNPLATLSNSQDATGAEYATPILDQYKRALANPPAYQEPSKTRQVLGALAGMGAGASPAGMSHSGPVGFRYDPAAQQYAQQSVTEAPNIKAQQKYATEVGMLGKGAQVEEQALAQKRGIEKLQADIANKQKEFDIKQQQADTQYQKERDIHETKLQKLQDDRDKLQQQLDQKNKEFEGKQSNVQQQLDLHKLQIQLNDAAHQLTIAQRDRALEEAKRQHDAEKAKWDHEKEIAEAKLKAAEEAAKAKQQPTETTTEERKVGGVDLGVLGHWGGTKQKVVTKKPVQADPLGIR